VRRLLVTAAVTAGLLVVGDRLAVTLAEEAVAAQVQSSADLPAKPDVDISGFPFLTQALDGRYREVTVGAEAVPTGGVPISELRVDLTGLEVPLGDALSGTVGAVPVSGLRATALLSYADLSKQSGSRALTVSRGSGDRVVVTGSLQVLGRRVSATALSTVRLSGRTVIVTAKEVRVGNEVADALLTRAIGDRLDLRVTVQRLPYGLVPRDVAVEADGVALTASAGATVLRRSGLR
jgi:hypothetical protein